VPTAPDDRTLFLTVTTPTPSTIAGASRELLRRPPRTREDLLTGRHPAGLAVLRVRDLYPSLHRVPDRVLLAAAHSRPGACGWCEVRLAARAHGQRWPPVNAVNVAFLGQPCQVCQPPKPRPRPKPKARATATTRARTRPTARARPPRRLAAAAGPHPSARVTKAQAAYNAAALRRLGIDPARWPHLTRPGGPR
jgi:hypothetical protein